MHAHTHLCFIRGVHWRRVIACVWSLLMFFFTSDQILPNVFEFEVTRLVHLVTTSSDCR